MCVELGVVSLYDLNDPYPAYNFGWWQFLAIAGYSSSPTYNALVALVLPMIGTTCLDYGTSSQSYTNYADYLEPSWTHGYDTWNPIQGNVWYNMNYYGAVENYEISSSLGDRGSIEGMTQGGFIFNSQPLVTHYYYCSTQIPSGHSVPSGIQSFAYLTAHNYRNGGDW